MGNFDKRDDLSEALAAAIHAHEGQTDKAGRPYIQHICHVVSKMQTKEQMIVAALHDVVEDSDTTIQDIEFDFGSAVSFAVDCITKRKGEPYQDYLERVMKSPLATVVKLVDLQHNSDLMRLDCVTDEDVKRKYKYLKAITDLQISLSE